MASIFSSPVAFNFTTNTAQIISSGKLEKVIATDTNVAKLELPSNMLNMERKNNVKDIEISIKKLSEDSLPQKA